MSDSNDNEDDHRNKRQKLDNEFNSTETTIRNGIEIPSDSALLTTTDDLINDATAYLPPDLLIKHNLAALPLSLQAHDSLPIRTQFVINSLPLLENISTQILRLIGVGPYEETLAIITNEEPTAEGLVYRDLVGLFEQVKRLFSEDDPFLQVGHVISNIEQFNTVLNNDIKMNLKDLEEKIDSTLRKTNLATFLLATLGSIEIGFFFLDESFLDVFCPVDNSGWINNSLKSLNNGKNANKSSEHLNHQSSGKLLKAPAALFLELKTQAFISSLESGDRSKSEILEDIFPSDLEQTLLTRRPNASSLTPVESDFINRCNSRKETLAKHSTIDDKDLSDYYDWLIFLKELFNYVSKNIGYLIWGKRGRSSGLPSSSIKPTQLNLTSTLQSYGNLTKEEIQKKLEEHKKKELELKEKDRLQLLESEKPKRKAKSRLQTLDSNSNDSTNNESTSSGSNKKQGTSENGPPLIRNLLRRPWTEEEDAALMEALKEVGPYWARILELHGAGGSRSEALKNRTQVQLKDKARNWKMSFLKNGTPIPEYLTKVTGEVERNDKTSAARKRQRQKIQEERERLLKERDDKNTKPEVHETNSSKKESETPPQTEQQTENIIPDDPSGSVADSTAPETASNQITDDQIAPDLLAKPIDRETVAGVEKTTEPLRETGITSPDNNTKPTESNSASSTNGNPSTTNLDSTEEQKLSEVTENDDKNEPKN